MSHVCSLRNVKYKVLSPSGHTVPIGRSNCSIGMMSFLKFRIVFSKLHWSFSIITEEKHLGILIYAVYLCTELCKANKDACASLRRQGHHFISPEIMYWIKIMIDDYICSHSSSLIPSPTWSTAAAEEQPRSR
jgi:hypothetical protein